MMNAKKPVFIYSKELEKYSYPADAMFVTQRAGKTRDLAASLGLLGKDCGREVAPVCATPGDMQKFHTQKYLAALQNAAQGKVADDFLSMGLGTPDCPVFDDMFDYASWACGATLTGAELILSGETDIAFNPSGGFHHAKAEKAEGLCYINDLVLACLRFTTNDRRVLYLDIDAHHGNGVQDAFYKRDDVMVISLHESGKTLFPWTGFEEEIGEGPGKGYNVNLPVPVGICDDTYLLAFNTIVIPLIKAYNPDVFVLQLGMDALAGDLLAHLELTNNVHAEIIERILAFNKPVLATGGGGYHVDNTVRGWALAWKIMCGQHEDNIQELGMGGVMLQSTEWAGGLRDRRLAVNEEHCASIDRTLQTTMQYLIQQVFRCHGI
jgi:acetoin utilization protein AcuC